MGRRPLSAGCAGLRGAAVCASDSSTRALTSRTAAESVRPLSPLCTALEWILRECAAAAGSPALHPESVGLVRGRLRHGVGASSAKWPGGRNSADAHACLPTERLLPRGGECHALWVTVACNCSDMVLIWGVRWSTLVWGSWRSQESGGGHGHEPRDSPDLYLNYFVLDVPALNIGFWNARGYLMQVGLHEKPRRKHAFFARLLRDAGNAAVADAHGMKGMLQHYVQSTRRRMSTAVFCSNVGQEA